MKARNVTYSEFLEFRVQDVVSANVKYYIARTGFTAEYLSNITNLSIATINRLKAGEHLSLQGICALAEALDIDPLLFFMEKDCKYTTIVQVSMVLLNLNQHLA